MSDLISLLRQFRNRRVLVVGDGGRDEWCIAERGRDFEDGTPTINVQTGFETPAMATFVADQCRQIGAHVVECMSYLNTHRRYVFGNERFGVRRTSTWHGWCKRSLADLLTQVQSQNAVILSDYGKGVCTPETCRAIIDAANEHGIPVLVDPARGADWAKYAGASVIKCSEDEDGQASDMEPVVETKGAYGMTLCGPTERDWPHIPAYTPAGPHIDAIGCGDICAAVLGLTLAVGAPLLDGCRLAAVVAGMKTQYRGCRAITAEEVERELVSLPVP